MTLVYKVGEHKPLNKRFHLKSYKWISILLNKLTMSDGSQYSFFKTEQVRHEWRSIRKIFNLVVLIFHLNDKKGSAVLVLDNLMPEWPKKPPSFCLEYTFRLLPYLQFGSTLLPTPLPLEQNPLDLSFYNQSPSTTSFVELSFAAGNVTRQLNYSVINITWPRRMAKQLWLI